MRIVNLITNLIATKIVFVLSEIAEKSLGEKIDSTYVLHSREISIFKKKIYKHIRLGSIIIKYKV